MNCNWAYISKGAYGRVYKGTDLDTGDLYALKVTDYSGQCCQGVPPQVLREISALAELNEYNHANLVKLLRVHVKPSKVNLIFEFC